MRDRQTWEKHMDSCVALAGAGTYKTNSFQDNTTYIFEIQYILH